MAPKTFGVGSLLASCALGVGLSAAYFSARTNQDVAYQELAALMEALDVVQRVHVSPPDSRTLVEDAIAGMAFNLDEYSEYLDAETYRMLEEETQASYVGIGIEVAPSPKGMSVVAVIPNSPAERAQLQSGDVIVRVNGGDMAQVPLDVSVSMIRGREGTSVQLTILRDGETFERSIVRAQVDMETIRAQLLQDGVAWIRVYQFSDDIHREVRDAFRALADAYGSTPRGLILDLRGNPGGLLGEAVNIADLFLDRGNIVSVRGVSDEVGESWEARARTTIYGGPMIVLIDEGSASASEVVAGALQDLQRATIVGHTSFGKGSVQSIIPLHGGGALKLTSSHYVTPSGRCVHRDGIKPDIVLYDSRDASTNPHLAPRDVEIDAIVAEDDTRERERIGCAEPKNPPRGEVFHLDVATVDPTLRVTLDEVEDPVLGAALSVLRGQRGSTAPSAP